MNKYLAVILFGLVAAGSEAKAIHHDQTHTQNNLVYETNQTHPYTGRVVYECENGQVIHEKSYKEGREEVHKVKAKSGRWRGKEMTRKSHTQGNPCR